MAQYIDAAGLILNLIGAVVLYFYGVAPKDYFADPLDGYPQLSDEEWREGERQMKHDRLVSRVGFAALGLGFVLQFVALWVKKS
jgi:hypothetical protein